MFCESYRQSLSDAAARGEELPHALAQHLSGCEKCMANFAEERAMFALVDQSVRTTVNGDVPATLVHRVRASLAQAPRRSQGFSWKVVTVAATVAAIAVAGVFCFPRFTRKTEGRDARMAANTATSPPVTEKGFQPAFSSGTKRSDTRGTNARDGRGLKVTKTSLDVQINPENQRAMDQLIQLVHKSPEAADALAAKMSAADVVIEPIHVSEIAWKPLNEDSGVSKEK